MTYGDECLSHNGSRHHHGSHQLLDIHCPFLWALGSPQIITCIVKYQWHRININVKWSELIDATHRFIFTSDFTGRQRGVDCSVQAMQFSQGLWHKTVTQYTVLVAGDQPTGVVRWHVELESEVDPLKGNPPWSSGRLMWSIC